MTSDRRGLSLRGDLQSARTGNSRTTLTGLRLGAGYRSRLSAKVAQIQSQALTTKSAGTMINVRFWKKFVQMRRAANARTAASFGLELWRDNRKAWTLVAYDMKAGQKHSLSNPRQYWYRRTFIDIHLGHFKNASVGFRLEINKKVARSNVTYVHYVGSSKLRQGFRLQRREKS